VAGAPAGGSVSTAGTAGSGGDVALGASIYYDNCNTCHGATAQGSLGPNITPSATAGIGAWTYQQFYNAVRFAQAPDGSVLCAFMTPFTQTIISDKGLQDLYAFLNILPAVDTPNKGTYCPGG
jgi:mono/diheme cytochrome c family protein